MKFNELKTFCLLMIFNMDEILLILNTFGNIISCDNQSYEVLLNNYFWRYPVVLQITKLTHCATQGTIVVHNNVNVKNARRSRIQIGWRRLALRNMLTNFVFNPKNISFKLYYHNINFHCTSYNSIYTASPLQLSHPRNVIRFSY